MLAAESCQSSPAQSLLDFVLATTMVGPPDRFPAFADGGFRGLESGGAMPVVVVPCMA